MVVLFKPMHPLNRRIFESSITNKIFIMKKVTLFLAVLIFATSLTSCYEDDFSPVGPVAAVAVGAVLVIWALSGKVTQEIPLATAPEIYQLSDDFEVNYVGNVLTINTSFTKGGQLQMEINQSEEGEKWYVSDLSFENNKAMQNRFDISPSDPTNLAILKFDQVTKEIELNFDLVIQDLMEQTSMPMNISYEGNYGQ